MNDILSKNNPINPHFYRKPPMSRIGVTFEQVELAAEKMLGDGENPTIEKVRRLLGGTGSNSTLSKHLNDWRSQRLMATRDDLPAPHIPPDAVHAAVNRVWKEMSDESESRIKTIQEQSLAEIEEAKNQYRAAQETNRQYIDECNALREQVNHLTAQKELTTLDLKAEQQQRSLLEERCQAADKQYQVFKYESTERLAELHQLNQQQANQNKEQMQSLQTGYDKLLIEIKNQHEDMRQRHMLEVDALKTEKQTQKKTIDQLITRIQAFEIQIAELKASTQALIQEKENAIKNHLVQAEKSVLQENKLTTTILSELKNWQERECQDRENFQASVDKKLASMAGILTNQLNQLANPKNKKEIAQGNDQNHPENITNGNTNA